MEQEDFRQKIIEEMDQTFASDCLVSPENPFSIDNPDALVRKGTTLYAIFVPMYHERINFDHLLRRLFSSELAYGSKLHTLLILKEDEKLSEYGERVLNAAFCHISLGKIDAISYLSSRINITNERNKYMQAAGQFPTKAQADIIVGKILDYYQRILSLEF